MFNAEWCDVIKALPEQDGEYYILTSNTNNGEVEMFKCNYYHQEWQITLDENVLVLAYKPITTKEQIDKKEWLQNHKSEIMRKFGLHEFSCDDFEMVDNFEECFCDYRFWLENNYVHYIDGMYVVKVLF